MSGVEVRKVTSIDVKSLDIDTARHLYVAITDLIKADDATVGAIESLWPVGKQLHHAISMGGVFMAGRSMSSIIENKGKSKGNICTIGLDSEMPH